MAKHLSKIKGEGGYPMGPWPENRGGEGGTPWARGLKTRGGGILGILGRLKVFWGPSWGHLGAVLGRLGAVLGWFGGRLGDVWGEVMRCLRASRGVSMPLWSVWSLIFAPKLKHSILNAILYSIFHDFAKFF